MSMTYGEALAMASVSIPEHLKAEAEVPVITGRPQAQGDLVIIPVEQAYEPGDVVPDWPHGDIVPEAGVQVVHGEATGNTHWLHQGLGSAGVRWHRADAGLVVGVVTVPAGETAALIHTDEHGCNAFGGPERYEIRRKREQLDEIAYVAD